MLKIVNPRLQSLAMLPLKMSNEKKNQRSLKYQTKVSFNKQDNTQKRYFFNSTNILCISLIFNVLHFLRISAEKFDNNGLEFTDLFLLAIEKKKKCFTLSFHLNAFTGEC